MKLRMRALSLAFALAAIGAACVFAQAPQADPRLAKALDSVGVKYDVNSYGNYLVLYTMSKNEERSQNVVVMSKTEKYDGIEIRELYAIGAELDDYPDSDTLLYLLEQSATMKIGSWGVDYGDSSVYILFSIKVPADIGAEALNSFIYFAAEVADEFEEEFTGEDNY